ncbi:MAG: hypothetical protein AAF456_23230, partial [Planctomycetota bacterium]
MGDVMFLKGLSPVVDCRCAVLFLAVFHADFLSAQYESNLVRNPGFESDIESWKSQTPDRIQRIRYDSIEGDWSLAIEHGRPIQSTSVYNRVTTDASRGAFELSINARSEIGFGSINLRIRVNGNAAAEHSRRYDLTGYTGWQKLALDFHSAEEVQSLAVIIDVEETSETTLIDHVV